MTKPVKMPDIIALSESTGRSVAQLPHDPVAERTLAAHPTTETTEDMRSALLDMLSLEDHLADYGIDTEPGSAPTESPVTHVIIGGGAWGAGESLKAATDAFTAHGGKLDRRHTIYEFGPESVYEGVDELGGLHYNGNAPAAVKR